MWKTAHDIPKNLKRMLQNFEGILNKHFLATAYRRIVAALQVHNNYVPGEKRLNKPTLSHINPLETGDVTMSIQSHVHSHVRIEKTLSSKFSWNSKTFTSEFQDDLRRNVSSVLHE